MAFAKKEAAYVDVGTDGKAIALDVQAVCDRFKLNGKAVDRLLSEMRSAQELANAKRDEALAMLEAGMAKAGGLDDNMALAPWFNFGKRNVVRVYGQRHGIAKTKVPGSDSAAANVAALFAPSAPQSRLIARPNGRGK